MRFALLSVIALVSSAVGCGSRSRMLPDGAETDGGVDAAVGPDAGADRDGAEDTLVADAGFDAVSNDAGADNPDVGCFPGELAVSLNTPENLCTQAAMGEAGVKVLFISFEANPVEAVDIRHVIVRPHALVGSGDAIRSLTVVNEDGNLVAGPVAGPIADAEFIRFPFPQDGSVDVTVPDRGQRQFVLLSAMNTVGNGVESGTQFQVNLPTPESGVLAVGAVGRRSRGCVPEFSTEHVRFSGAAAAGELPGPIITVYQARPWTEFAPDTPRGNVGPGRPGQIDAHLIVHNIGDVDLVYDAPYGLIRLMSDFPVSSALACAYWDLVAPENLSDCARHEGRLGNIADGIGGNSRETVFAGVMRHVYFTVDTHEAPPGGAVTLQVSGPGVWSDGVTGFIPEHCGVPTERITLVF